MPDEISRREFVKGMACVGLAGFTACAATKQETVETNYVKVPIADKASNFKNYRIAFLSDVHHGPFLPLDWLAASINILSKEDYDLLLLGGDYINVPDNFKKKYIFPWQNSVFDSAKNKSHMINMIYKSLGQELSPLKAKDGKYAVLGNHDVWQGPSQCRYHMAQAKVKLMFNDTLKIKRGEQTLEIRGVEDYWTGFPFLEKAVQKDNKLRLVVSHNPDFIADSLVKTDSYFDLALAGHTHGGQIRLPGIGSLSYNVRDLRFIEGLVELDNHSYVFTSKGLGTVEIPYRVNCPPEVCIIELV